MQIRTQRWNDPPSPDDGLRVLVCRYRPRGVRKDQERWDVWLKDLGPSEALHAAFYGKGQAPISLEEYRSRFLREMESQGELLEALKRRLAGGEPLTLLCSSACTDPARCHRTLLASLLTR